MTNRFHIHNTPISELKVIQRNPLHDSRGYLERFFCQEELGPILQKRNIQQINHTATKKAGTVRGMHFQISPYCEAKFVSCLKGGVFDVAIDLRKNSPTFLSCHAEILTDSNCKTMYIPEGFAHGFQALSDDCEMLYFHTNVYFSKKERGVNALDPQFNIKWPLPIAFRSERDIAHPILDGNFAGISL